MNPLFLFSLPRSGSTLLQRVLASHEKISTTSEPWILLPLLYTLKKKGVYSEYSHKVMSDAIEDFCTELPNGREDYLHEMKEYALQLYAKASRNETKYFLDKTPRYHLVVDDILDMFPEGKFILLWRNPLAVIASMIDTWGNGKWKLYLNKVDLFKGLASLIEASEKHKERICVIKYEDLIINPEQELKRAFDYLELPFTTDLLSSFIKVDLKGRMGDPIGIHEYSSVSAIPLNKWKLVLANPVRKVWCYRYLRWIGKERLAVMGYDLHQLTNELKNIPTSYAGIVSDLFRIIGGLVYSYGEPAIFMDKSRQFIERRYINAHR